MTDGAAVRPGLVIPRQELQVRATRAGGPGGQHVNTSSTRIEVLWNVRRSAVLSDAERKRLITQLASRLDAAGNLRVVASEHRSQARNRQAALERLGAMVRKGLHVPRSRKATRPTRTSVEKRLKEKKQIGARKRERRERDFD